MLDAYGMSLKSSSTWLIVEYANVSLQDKYNYNLVSSAVLCNALDLHTGKVVEVKSRKSARKAYVVMVSEDKKFLETQLRNLREESRLLEEAKQDDTSDDSHAGDFSFSGSDWDPKEHTSSESEDEFSEGHRRLSSNGSSNKKLSFDTKGPIVDGAYHKNIGLTIKILTEYLGNTVENVGPGSKDSNNDTNKNDDCQSSAKSKMASLHEALQSQLNAFVHEEENLSTTTSEKHTQTLDSGDIITRALELANIFKLSEDILEALQVKRNYLQVQINETYQQLMALKKRLRQTACTFPSGYRGAIKIMSEKLKDIKARKHERKLNRAVLKSKIRLIRNELTSAESLITDPKGIQICNNETVEELHGKHTCKLDTDQTNSNNSIGHCSKYEPTTNVAALNVEPPPVNDPYSIEIEFPTLSPETYPVAASMDNGSKSKITHRTSSDQVSSSNHMSSEIINTVNDQALVPIGTGRTFINSYEYAQLNWNSHTMATRKLLLAVFSRNELATHSLTGKPSPAFANKPTKLQLDPVKINDIIIEVSKGCRVQPRYVRSAITTKCADENKMRKIRLRKGKRKRKPESENLVDNRVMESQENVNPQVQT